MKITLAAAATPLRPAPAAPSPLLEACREVEGLFLSHLLETMDRQPFGEGMLGSSAATAAFRTQRNQALAEEMGRRGDLGLAQMLYDDLSRAGNGS